MFKRILIALLCVLAVTSSMTGCIGQNSTENNTESESISSTEKENNELSSDEALKIAKEYWKNSNIEENGYLVLETENKKAPENFYVFVLKHRVQIGDSSYYSTIDEVWVDRFTGEAMPPFDAMQMYEAAIKGEICVFDERLGEINLKSLRFSSNSTSLDECKLLTRAILDIDQDGVNEYVIQSPNYEHIILHYNNGKVYSYWLDDYDFYSFNTDGTFYWCNSPESSGMTCGLSKIIFDGETMNVKSIYSLKYSENPTKYEYFVGGKSVTEFEYDDCRNSLRKEMMKFSQFELTCSYPVTAEQAWNLANAYWDNRDGLKDHAAGTVFTHRIVLIDTPNSDSDYYRVALQVELSSNGGRAGDECMPPYDMQLKDQILVNAFTGDIIAPTDSPSDDGVSVDEAIRIADEYWGCINGKTDAACGTTLLCRIVVSNDPTPVFPFYRLVWQIEYYSNCGAEGYEDGSPYIIETYKEVLVNIYTGECCADTQPDEKG